MIKSGEKSHSHWNALSIVFSLDLVIIVLKVSQAEILVICTQGHIQLTSLSLL